MKPPGRSEANPLARIDDIALIDMPADDSGPRCINCYSVEVERSDAIDGRKFKLDPSRLVYSLQWKHNAHPPDFELVLVQAEPPDWIKPANLTLLAELRRGAPHAIDWESLTAAGIVQMLDDFEAARVGQMARHH